MTAEMKQRRLVGRWRCATVVLAILCVVLIVALIAVGVLSHRGILGFSAPFCASGDDNIDLSEPENPSPFHDLTQMEITGLQKYLYSVADLNLVKPVDIRVNSSYMYSAELLLPPKADTLDYLDNGAAQPPRQVKVIIFRGDKDDPDVEEYVVGPLPSPTEHRLLNKNAIPFRYRQSTNPETVAAITYISDQCDKIAANLLEESYGGTLKNCGNKCLTFAFLSMMSSALSGKQSRLIWYWLVHDIEYISLHPLDFGILINLDGKNVENYRIEKVWYSGKGFDSLDMLVAAYESNSISKTKISFPIMDGKSWWSSINHRGEPLFKEPTRVPYQVDPAGKRYHINGRHVSYSGWDFDFRMSSGSGPQVYDIRYKNERIVYELSLQEIAAYYSGVNPMNRFSNYLDSTFMIGLMAKAVVPGADCPDHATMISATHLVENSEEPTVFENAFCIFEHNTGIPLRRHHADGEFYEGMQGVVLILRTVATVLNYDYIFDFKFYQNGAIEGQVIPTGYILNSFSADSELKYGYKLHDNIVGNMHYHMFNFKADMDIKGRSNRFQTLNILPEMDDNDQWSVEPNAKYAQTYLVKSLKTTERDAAYKFNFDTPKDLVFFNEGSKSRLGNSHGYRVLLKSNGKQLTPRGANNEPAVSWARYQMAVTKQKDSELRSSSTYAIWDAQDPVVNFENFLEDNENIVDEDLVAWISMGVHHIPHTEDLPVTPTVGLNLNFFLLPYNYFDEDPAIGSRNAIRIDVNKDARRLDIERYGVGGNTCAARENDYDEKLAENPGIVLDMDRDVVF